MMAWNTRGGARRPARRTIARIEALETRSVPTFTSAFSLAAGTLTLTGTPSAETAIVRTGADGRFTVNGGRVYDAASHSYAAYNNVRIIYGYGNESADTIDLSGATGYSGASFLNGGAGNDTLVGGAGDDRIEGGSGDDTMSGGAGDDTYVFRAATAGIEADFVVEFAGQGTDRMDFGSLPADDNMFLALNDDPRFFYMASTRNRLIFSGEGEPAYLEDVTGGAGNDVVLGNDSANLVYGGAGNDRIAGNGGNDTIQGGTGHDVILGDSGRDWLYGGDGYDQLFGGDDGDRLEGGLGDDGLYGGPGDDTYHFGAATAGAELDYVVEFAGGGNDYLDFTTLSATDPLFADLYFDTVGTKVAEHAGRIVNSGEGTPSQIENVFGGAGDDWIIGSDAANLLNGAGGADRIYGIGGVDSIAGGAGDDAIYGGDATDFLSGGAGNDLVDGGAGNDRLQGDLGDDRIYGGFGDDNYVFEDATAGFERDRVYEYPGGGTDTLNFSGVRTGVQVNLLFDVLASHLNRQVTTDPGRQADFENATGGFGDDWIVGNAADNVLDGGAYGNDRLEGGVGNDRLYGWAGDDTLLGGAGIDIGDGGDGVDILRDIEFPWL